MPTRRDFVRRSIAAGLGLPAARLLGQPASRAADPGPLARHFIFEYYPWYARQPFRHWDQWDRRPPADLASRYYPLLGPYDSRDAAVLARHARWIADSGAGAVNVSWWGADRFEDHALPLLMDVMRDHGLKVTFHLEPYDLDHVYRFAEDVLYLLRSYGERRRYDALLLLRDADGREGPILKGFRTILRPREIDCHGHEREVPDYTPDSEWRRQVDRLRQCLREEFDHLTLLADSLDFDRTRAAGFDGIAIYDPFVRPDAYAGAAAGAASRDLLFSFNVNPGYDGILPRRLDEDICAAAGVEPQAQIDWSDAGELERAADRSAARIVESLEATLRVQSDPALSNAKRGFLAVYINSFNEWHEGHMFEPMRDREALGDDERSFGYHNPADGGYRLATLTAQLRRVLSPESRPDRG